MMMFWILAALATSLAALLVFGAARRGVTPVEPEDSLAGETARRELASLDRLRADGLLGEAEWAEARAEAGRRWLDRSDTTASPHTGRHDRRILGAGVLLAVAATLGLYFVLAEPGFPDQPYAERVETWAQSTEPLEPVQVAAVLEREVRDRPDDRRMLTMLGSARFQAGDSVGAASAFRRALALDPNDAQSWARLGESLVRSQDGEVGLDAEAAFREALRRDPGQLGALYFLGDAALKRGDVNAVRILWTPLIRALAPSDPRRVDLERRLSAAGVAAPAGGAAG